MRIIGKNVTALAIVMSALIIGLNLFVAPFSYARDITLNPKLAVTETYDDNVVFSRENEEDDYITSVKPSLYFDYKTEISTLISSINTGLNYYALDSDLNYQTYDGKAELYADIMELISVEVGGQFIKDTTLESELEETGRVQFREDRHRYDYFGRMGIDLTELTKIAFGYSYRQVEYDYEGNIDYNIDAFSFDLTKKLKNQIDSIKLNIMYTLRESQPSESDTYIAGLEWRREFSESFSYHLLTGYRWTEEYTNEKERSNSQGLLVNAGLFKQWQRTSLGLGYSRDLISGADGEDLVVDKVNADMTRSVSERTRLNLSLRYYMTKGDLDDSDEDSRYFQVEPKITYNITEHHRFNFGYRFSFEHDKTQEDKKNRSRNRIWINLTFAFPEKWS